jgi:hypothetical protein
MKIENNYSRIKRWLRAYLIAREGTAFITDILKDAKDAGYSDNAVYAVRHDAGLQIKVKRKGFGKDGKWFWEIPYTASNASDFNYNAYKGDGDLSEKFVKDVTQWHKDNPNPFSEAERKAWEISDDDRRKHNLTK